MATVQMLLLLLAAAASPALQLALAFGNVTFPLPDYCQTSCGGIPVSYPFGFQDGCFRPGFELFCNNSTQPHKLFLGDGTTQVFSDPTSKDWIQNGYIFIEPLSQVVNISSSSSSGDVSWTAGDAGRPYALSSSSNTYPLLENIITVVGCGVHAALMGSSNSSYAGCTTTCDQAEQMTDGVCAGVGCCQIQIPGDLPSYRIRVDVLNGTRQANSTAAVKILTAYNGAYQFKLQDLYDTGAIRGDGLMAVLKWGIPDLVCIEADKDASSYACLSDHSECKDGGRGGLGGYTCACLDDDNGNAYVPHGCKAKCRLGICNKLVLGVIIGICVGLVVLILPGLVFFISRKWKQRKERKLKEKHFRQNHGLLLQQLISSNEDIGERTRIFSLEDMKKATNNFDVSRVLGRGGHGTVYKGILTDQHVVAIKKSKIEVKSEIDQFINEVAILSRITHRNIVRLFGCCLETEVPLLVYEFISNGTLSDHLHPKDGKTSLSWEDRLRIAAESAGALAYLHSSAFISIFHRDVKSSNILLDDTMTAKVSDFGASRSVPINETHVVTVVQGTYGYLDPQYYYTGELTDKSDVYSFGVILLELLTGRPPISMEEASEGRNLSVNFVQAMKENRHFDLMEVQVVKEGTKEELEEVAKLACACLSMETNARPTMKEVEFTLQELRRKRKQGKLALLKQNGAGEFFLAADSLDILNGAGLVTDDSISQSSGYYSSANYTTEKFVKPLIDVPR